MTVSRSKITEVLQTLLPRDEEGLSALRFLVACAQRIQKGGHADLSLRPAEALSLGDRTSLAPPAPLTDAHGFLTNLPEQLKRYFYGLIEAIDIYQSMRGQSLSSDALDLHDPVLQELRQIRDMCLEDGLRSIY